MNNDFKVIDDTLYSGVAAEDIIQRRKSPVIALIVALAGSALAVWSLTSDTMVDRGNLSSMLMLVGGLIAIVGFIKAGVTFSSINRPGNGFAGTKSIIRLPISRPCAPPYRRAIWSAW